MTQQTKMPEPVAWLRSDQLRKLGEPYSDSPLNEKSDSMMLYAKGTPQAAKQYGHDIAVITTDQAEAYKDACVRAALEAAVHAMPNEPFAVVVDRIYEDQGVELAIWNGVNYEFADGDCYEREGDTLDGYTASWLTHYRMEQLLNDEAVRPYIP